ncbi:hypothetical protein MMC16_000015 [Acarospora aff. strigata]|nr:hypothetical protein [Acarospora aff. strigata]
MPQALTYSGTSSDATSTLRLQEFDCPCPQKDELLIKFLAAPINPLDLLVLAGKYPVKPANNILDEKIPGFDGVAQVIECGEGVGSFEPGDIVIPDRPGLGTWRTHATVQATTLMKIPPLSDVAFGAILKMGVMPAYLLLEDMKTLRPGDWIIQNAGTGVIAQLIAQFAKLRGVHTISVIRDRKDLQDLESVKAVLRRDADIVLEDSELRSEISKDKRIVLALDSVFGSTAEKLAACLSDRAMFVNYGLLGGGGPAATFSMTHEHIFWKQITFGCFRVTRQLELRSEVERKGLYHWFTELFNAGLLRLPNLEIVGWNVGQGDLEADLLGAVGKAQSHDIGTRKQIFKFDFE